MKKGDRSRKNLSRYCVSQYCANQFAFVRLSWSWKRGLGGVLVRIWNEICFFYTDPKSKTVDVRKAVSVWNRVLSGNEVILRIPGLSYAHVIYPLLNLHFEYLIYHLLRPFLISFQKSLPQALHRCALRPGGLKIPLSKTNKTDL